jgi:hypothetical protein
MQFIRSFKAMEVQGKSSKKSKTSSKGDAQDPVHVVREGALAASIWLRQSPSGYAYFDFSLSRSWKSMSTDKTGYSKNFFENNKRDLISVIEQASAWIAAQREEPVSAQNKRAAA